MESIAEKQIVSFLLGELAEEPRAELEERLFVDDGLYERVLAIQEELADDFVHDQLSTHERASFEKSQLNSSRGRQRVEFAYALSRALTKPEPEVELKPLDSPWWRPMISFFRPTFAIAATFVALALLVGVVWLANQNRRFTKEIAEFKNEQESSAGDLRQTKSIAEQAQKELEVEISQLRAEGEAKQTEIRKKQSELENLKRQETLAASPNLIATFDLLPGMTRSVDDQPENLIVPRRAQTARLILRFQKHEDFPKYKAEIRTSRGNLVWSKAGLSVSRVVESQSLILNIPANLLSTGEYEITVAGVNKDSVQAIGYYYFIALRR